MADVDIGGAAAVEASPVGPVVRPAGAGEMVILYLHGDRNLSGTPEPAPGPAKCLALRTGATVVCAEYRPSFHAALEDVQAAYRFSAASGRVALAGERVGAELAAALLIRLRDLGAAPPACAVLVSAVLDMTLQAPSILLNAAADTTFDVADLQRHVARYAGTTAPTDPQLSPLYANLHGLPPVQLLVAGTDPLLDDSLAFAARGSQVGRHGGPAGPARCGQTGSRDHSGHGRVRRDVGHGSEAVTMLRPALNSWRDHRAPGGLWCSGPLGWRHDPRRQ